MDYSHDANGSPVETTDPNTTPLRKPDRIASDDAIEQEILAKGLTAPRVTPQMVKDAIIDETFTILPSGRTTICELTLRNGFTVRGESSCVDIRNFDAAIGARIAYDNARNKVWELEGYLLCQRLFDQEHMTKVAGA